METEEVGPGDGAGGVQTATGAPGGVPPAGEGPRKAQRLGTRPIPRADRRSDWARDPQSRQAE